MSDQEALFDSTHEALIFAYNFADQQFAKSLMARLYAKLGSGKGLGGIGGAGEAGMIMASVLCRAIIKSGIKFDQLIKESTKTSQWVHIGFGARMRQQVLTYKNGQYFNGLV